MVTPRTPTRRRTSTTIVEPSEDTTKTKVVIPAGTKAMINEQIGGKNVTFEAEVVEDESADQNENNELDNDFETDFDLDESADYPTIAKTPLDKMFDNISVVVKGGYYQDIFLAKLVRQPDQIGDKFNIPNRDIMDLGALQFTSADRFNFITAIQEMNNNSGGRFNIFVYTSDYEPLRIFRREVNLFLKVPNPRIIIQENHQNGSRGNESELAIVLREIQNQNRILLETVNKPPQEDEFSKTLKMAMLQKLTNDFVNPPKPENTANEIIANVMSSVAVSSALGAKIASSIHSEPPAPPEPDLADKVNKWTEMPIIQQIGGRIMDIADAVAVKGLHLDNVEQQPPDIQNTNNAPLTGNSATASNNQGMTEIQELIVDIIDEIKTDNVLGADNDLIKELRENYPEQFADLVSVCKGATFEFVFDQLVRRTRDIQPTPFYEFLDTEQTQAQQKFVWNEAGEHMKVRLRKLYEYLKTVE